MAAVESWSEVGERVRDARSAAGLSQAELARRIGIDRTAQVRVESGDRGLSALELSRLAETLGIPVSHFLTRSPGPVAAYRAAIATGPDSGADIVAERIRYDLDVELEKHARDATWLLDHHFIEPVAARAATGVANQDEALALARRARRELDNAQEPIGPLATVAEKFGLYIKVVPRGTSGASLQIVEGLGVAVVGTGSDPGRRRSTAAHELGHHLVGDKYNSDAGVAASDRDRERLIDWFAAEFLLPGDVLVARVGRNDPYPELKATLVAVSGEYRVSWSTAVTSARQLDLLSPAEHRRLLADVPGRGDFMAVLGREPGPDLTRGVAGPRWRRAVLAAWKTGFVTAERTVDLLNDALKAEELPAPDSDGNGW